ncbi:MAG: hypothetical protein IBJ07_12260 [Rhizobiaceae bacterium]|nr:hypothetical protein [Rhizobiaceae bacterium]
MLFVGRALDFLPHDIAGDAFFRLVDVDARQVIVDGRSNDVVLAKRGTDQFADARSRLIGKTDIGAVVDATIGSQRRPVVIVSNDRHQRLPSVP